MEVTKNARGFLAGEFEDYYGSRCSLSKSSLATEDTIWFGIAKPKVIVHDKTNDGKYVDADVPDSWNIHSRMHLTREQVKDLLPHLQKFVDIGEL